MARDKKRTRYVTKAIDLTEDEPSDVPVVPTETEQEVAGFMAALRLKFPKITDQELDSMVEKARLHDSANLPGGILFEEMVDKTASFLKIAGVQARNVYDDSSKRVDYDERDPVVCNVCMVPNSILMDPFFTLKRNSYHKHLGGVCLGCATEFVQAMTFPGVTRPNGKCPLCAVDTDLSTDMISDAPYFTYSPERSLMAAAYKKMATSV
eukprot:jgi/Mesvir1/1545/Mv14528-RA.1